jgi:hypothetical protein
MIASGAIESPLYPIDGSGPDLHEFCMITLRRCAGLRLAYPAVIVMSQRTMLRFAAVVCGAAMFLLALVFMSY